ncbi:MAG: hypothetical protein ACPGQL_01730 [Thermoplasmatota archaeon]
MYGAAGEEIGNITFEFHELDKQIATWAARGQFDDEELRGRISYDMVEGRTRSVTQDLQIDFPWGVRSVLPSHPSIADEALLRLAPLVGLGLHAQTPEDMEGHPYLSDASVARNVDGEGRRLLTVRAPCEAACGPLEGPPIEHRVEAAFGPERLFASNVSILGPDGRPHLDLGVVKEAGEVTVIPAILDGDSWAVHHVDRSMEAGPLGPANGQSGSKCWSFDEISSELFASNQWQDWEEDHPDWFLIRSSVRLQSPVGNFSILRGDEFAWSFTLGHGSESEAHLFVLEGICTPISPVNRPIASVSLDSPMDGSVPAHLMNRGPGVPDRLVSMGALFDRAELVLGALRRDVHAIEWMLTPVAANPTATSSSLASIEAEDGRSLLLSGHDGRLLRVSL